MRCVHASLMLRLGKGNRKTDANFDLFRRLNQIVEGGLFSWNARSHNALHIEFDARPVEAERP
jgi:hypothetical protein